MIVYAKELKQALTAASKHAGKKGSVSLVTQGTELQVIGCAEWETSLVYLLAGHTESWWVASLDPGPLLKALGKTSTFGEVLLEAEDGQLLLQQLNQADQTFPLLEQDPPAWDLRGEERCIRMPAYEWMWAVRSTVPFMSPDPTRHIIYGVLVEIGDKALEFNATDTNRLTHHEIPVWTCRMNWEEGPDRLVIPADAMNLCLDHQSGHEDEAHLFYDPEKHRLTISVGPQSITARLIREGEIRFPDWRRLEKTLDTPYTQARTLNAEHLAVAARALASIADREEAKRIRVTLADSNMDVETTGPDGEVCSLSRTGIVTGDDLQVAWHQPYLAEAAELFNKGKAAGYYDVTIHSRSKDLYPTKWTSPDYPGFHLLMPMRWDDPEKGRA